MTTPEMQLWTMVLAQSILDLHAVRVSGCANRAALAADVRAWFQSSKITPGSFRWITTVLNLDAPTVRRKAFELDRTNLKRRVESQKMQRGQARKKTRRARPSHHEAGNTYRFGKFPPGTRREHETRKKGLFMQ